MLSLARCQPRVQYIIMPPTRSRHGACPNSHSFEWHASNLFFDIPSAFLPSHLVASVLKHVFDLFEFHTSVQFSALNCRGLSKRSPEFLRWCQKVWFTRSLGETVLHHCVQCMRILWFQYAFVVARQLENGLQTHE